MFKVSVGHPEHGPEILLKVFETHGEALGWAEQLDRLLGVDISRSELNDQGVCALIDEEEEE